MKKQYAVFGLGSFGESAAITLQGLGCDVIAVDNHMERIEEISKYVSYAMKADIEDPEVIRSLGTRNLDGVIVAIADNMEASIMATLVSKDEGVPYVLAKAKNELHATVLRKIGADSVIFPEKEAGSQVAKSIVSSSFADWVALSPEYSVMEMVLPETWIGKSLEELNVRRNHGVNVIGLKKPNPLGFYDILGNVAEMMLDPFYATRTGRLHGQSGGYIVRGGSIMSSQSEISTALRLEKPFYLRGKESKGKDNGMRLALALPQARYEADKKALSQDNKDLSESNRELLAAVGSLNESLKVLRQNMVEANIKRDEMRDRAIISSLRLGGYLCSTLASEQIALERNLKNESIIRKLPLPQCRANPASDDCKQAQADQEKKLERNRQMAESVLDYYASYYADHVADVMDTFGLKFLLAQNEAAQKSLGKREGNLATYIERFVDDLQQYSKSGRNLKENKQRWIKQCRALVKSSK